MKTNNSIRRGPAVKSSSGPAITVGIMLVLVGFLYYWSKERINGIHQELFNGEGPVTYEFDFGNFEVIARSKLSSNPRSNSVKWKEFPLMSQSQTYRVTHRIGFGSHTGTIELKVSDNARNAEFLNSDIVMEFVAGTNDVSLSMKPFEYTAPDFKLIFSDLSGSFSHSGHLKLKIKSLDVKMVNYLFQLSDVDVDVPEDKNSISVLCSKIIFDEVNLGHSKMTVSGMSPFEVSGKSSFDGQPVEVHWNVEKEKVEDRLLKYGHGSLRFPVALLNAYVDPKVNRLLLTQEQQASSASEKVRFLFSAAKEVKRAESRALALRALNSSSTTTTDGDFYEIRTAKADAFNHALRLQQRNRRRAELVSSWESQGSPQKYEEAFYAVLFGNAEELAAAKGFMPRASGTEKESSEYVTLKAYVALSEARLTEGEYNPALLEAVTAHVGELAAKAPEHKLTTLLALELARAKKDKATVYRLHDIYSNRESNPQIKALVEMRKYLHVDNAKALELLETAIALNPQGIYVKNAIHERIHILRHLTDTAKLESELQKVMTDGTPTADDLEAYTKLLTDKKEFRKALETGKKCLELSSQKKECQEQVEAIMTLIAYEMQKSDPTEAIEYLSRLVVDHPSSVAANAGLGFLHRMKGDQDASVKHFSIACALGGSSACIEAGDYLVQTGDLIKSGLLYDVSCDLKSTSGCLKAGLIIEKSGDLAAAESFFDRSCNQYRDNLGCYHMARNLRNRSASNKTIAPYLTRACRSYRAACKLASTYRSTNKQPEIPLEPK